MENKIARFEKVSAEQFKKDMIGANPNISEEQAAELYKSVILPKRGTKGSAGYDFFIPFELTLLPNQTALIPTGIKARIEEGWFLMCCPRSGLGFKFRLRLDNTVGIIDSDYYNADNEGHIQIKLTNESNEGKTVFLEKGRAFAQGIFIPYGITCDDVTDASRTGGFGSTDGNSQTLL